MGNLTYRKAARNFSPLMAAAAELTIVQASAHRRARRDRSRAGRHARHLRQPHRRSRRCAAGRGADARRSGLRMSAKLSNAQIAWRAAQDIEDGAYVNLGIGFPEMVAKFQPPGRQAIFHTENGILEFRRSAGRGRGGLGPHQCRQEGDDAEARRRLLPPCRQLRHGARRPSRRGDPRRLRSGRERRPRQLVAPAPRACPPWAARWTWCMAPSASR